MKRIEAPIFDVEDGRPTGPMALCQDHWMALRKAIETRGLPISPTKEALIATIEGKGSDALFDAFIDIIEHILEKVGPVAVMWQECPLDVMNREHEAHHKEVDGKTRDGDRCALAEHNGFDVWIEYAANAQVAMRTGVDPERVH